MKKNLFYLIASLLFIPPVFGENLVKNPDFFSHSGNSVENWTASDPSAINIEGDGNSRCMVLSSGSSPRYLSLNQAITIDPLIIKQITVRSLLKISGVNKGREEWEMARIMVLFFDKNGAQVGGWPELGRWTGSFDWTEKANVINVPDGSASVKIGIEMSNCTGTMSVRSISVEPGDNLNIPREDDNQLLNGDMEYGSTLPFYWGGWIAGTSSFESPGCNSPTCFRITNTSFNYSMITQEITADPKIKAVTISGYVKVSGVVQGTNVWEKARISVEFHDANGQRLGGWPAVIGESSGDIPDWTLWTNDYQVPEGTKTIVVGAGLLNCTGTIWFDKLKAVGRDKKGETLKVDLPKAEDRTGWFPFTYEQDDYRDGAVVDFTSIQDAPAGKHGFITKSDDGSLMFEDSTPARFWGTNIVAGDVFRSHIEADKMVKRLSKLGVNLVRLHHMDAFWADPSIISYSKGTSTELSADSLEKLDYFIYKLKDAGIYIYMDMLVHRRVQAGDGITGYDSIPAGLKEVIFIDDKLQDLTKEYITSLLTHVNQYTKTPYSKEPAIVFMEIVNESSLFYADRNKDFPSAYRAKLDKMFNQFLLDKYKTMDDLKQEWSKSGDSDIASNEDFNDGTVRRETFNVNWDDPKNMFSSACLGRGADTKEFYYQTEYVFFHKMNDYIKSLGVRALVAGSNHWEPWDADLKANASLDFIDRHSYWDHPSGGWSMQENITFKDLPMVKSKQNCVTELANGRVDKMPFTVSEWNSLIPNEFRAGAPIIMASYAAFQGWDAFLQFNFSNYEWKNILTHFADFSVCPDMLSNWAPAVMIYRSGYVPEGKEKMVEYVSDDDMFFTKTSSYKLVNNDYTTPLFIRCFKTFNREERDKKYDPKLKKDAALSMNQELYWNFKKGMFQIAADRVQGGAGFFRDEKEGVRSRNFRAKSKNLYASIFLVSLDSLPITNSSKLLLNTVARMDNTGTKYSPNHTSVIYGGSSPILLEPVYSECRITTARFKKVKIYTLDANNYKKDEYRNFSTPDKNTIYITTDERSKTLSYYIEITR
jgi:hypothetical protein